VRFEFKQGDNPYSDKKKDVKHSTRRRAEAVVRTDNKRKIKLDKARKQLKKTYQKPK
jgi:GTP-binding protein